MQYDIITGETEYETESTKFFTIGDLIQLCEEYPEHKFQFLGTWLTVGTLHSWRGSYNLPAISPDERHRTGLEIANQLKEELNEIHYGWKGGEYKYSANQEFYIAERGKADKYKVVGYKQEDDLIILLTKLDPY